VTTLRHVAHAVGSTGSDVAAYQVDVGVGAHRIVADEPAVLGGGDVGPSPVGLLASALTACTATTLRMYAERHGWELTSIVVDVRYDIDDNKQGSMTRTITVPPDVTGEQLDGLTSIAERTPVTLAIRAATPISTTFLREDNN
jgi:putative redox protein